MLDLFLKIIPILILICSAYYLKKTEFLSDGFFISSKRFLLRIALPAMIFLEISSSNVLIFYKSLSLLYTLTIVILIFSLIEIFILKKFNLISNKNFTSFFQGTMHVNTATLGIPVFILLFGKSNISAFLIVTCIMSILINIVAICVLSYFNTEKDGENRKLLQFTIKKSIFNPVVLSCILGIISSMLNFKYPIFITNTLSIISDSVILLTFISIGGTIKFTRLLGYKKEIIFSTILKLVLIPFIGIIFCYIFGIREMNADIIILYLSLPTATSAYILASDLRGNTVLLSNIVAIQTLVFAFLFPIIVYISHLLL